MRQKYQELEKDPAQIETMVREGAKKANAITSVKMQAVRTAVGVL